LRKFDENLSKIEIPSPGITNYSPGIESRTKKSGSRDSYSYAEGPSLRIFEKMYFHLYCYILPKVCMNCRYLIDIDINVLGKCNGYAMIINRNFGKYRQNLRNLDRNFHLVEILAPGLQIRSSGLNPEGKTIPGLRQVRKY
jgi:hypothetical protein